MINLVKAVTLLKSAPSTTVASSQSRGPTLLRDNIVHLHSAVKRPTDLPPSTLMHTSETRQRLTRRRSLVNNLMPLEVAVWHILRAMTWRTDKTNLIPNPTNQGLNCAEVLSLLYMYYFLVHCH